MSNILVCLSYQKSHVIPIMSYFKQNKSDKVFFYGDVVNESLINDNGFVFEVCNVEEVKELLMHRNKLHFNICSKIYRDIHNEVKSIIEKHNIEKLFCDISRYWLYALAAIQNGIEVITFYTYNAPTHYSPSYPPQSSKYYGDNKIRIRWEWVKHFVKSEIKSKKFLFYFTYPYRTILFQKDNLKILKYGYSGLFLDCRKIICGPKELAPWFDSKTFFTGICLNNETPLLESAFDIVRKKSKAQKIIYITFGTCYNRYRNLKTIVECLVQQLLIERNYFIILNLPKDFFVIKDNDYINRVFFLESINQEKLIGYCDLVIFHGGFGTLKECYYYGKKMIVIPFLFDQFSNARLVTKLNAGKVVFPKEIFKCDLLNIVDHLIASN